MKADVEFGGIDQKFNCLMGRELQGIVGQTPQHVFFMPLLVGTDGRQKMSKSLDNYIAVEDAPNDMYGKVMSIPDNLMMDYFELLTDVPDEIIDEFRQGLSSASVNPMTLKKRLAAEIMGQFHSSDAAQAAESYFESVVQRRGLPGDKEIVSYRIGHGADTAGGSGTLKADITKVLVEAEVVKSRGEAKRLIRQGAVEIDGVKIIEDEITLHEGSIIKVGRRRWVRIVNADEKQ
jgi:tyrosyl-tRNA synthetase